MLIAVGNTCGAGSPLEPPVRLESTNSHLLFRVTPRLFSGSQPEGDAAFAELARLGIRTIISVDGARPDTEAARRYGLRYVHLPFGYDGVPSNRVVELTAAASLPTQIYVHCNHGLHRGPTAVALMCLAREDWTTEQAEAWLKQAGTAADYRGLYRAVREFQAPNSHQLVSITSFPEVAQTSTLVESMVAIDGHLDQLKRPQQEGWNGLSAPPGFSAVHEATLLWEHLRELVRHTDTAGRPADYRDKLGASETAADAFRQILAETPDGPATLLDEAFRDLSKTCIACHKIYRN